MKILSAQMATSGGVELEHQTITLTAKEGAKASRLVVKSDHPEIGRVKITEVTKNGKRLNDAQQAALANLLKDATLSQSGLGLTVNRAVAVLMSAAGGGAVIA